MVRRGLALVGALSLVLSPGAVGLVRAFASLDTCGCAMGPGCPMCKARRAHEKKEAGCPCCWQRRGTGGAPLAAEMPALDPACLSGLAVPLVAAPAALPVDLAGLATSWLPDVPHGPPRA